MDTRSLERPVKPGECKEDVSMMVFYRKIAALLIVFALIVSFSAAPLQASEGWGGQEASADAMIFDAVFLRPLGLVSMVGGTAVFVVTIFFTVPSGSANQAADRLISDPARYTFARPLGVF